MLYKVGVETFDYQFAKGSYKAKENIRKAVETRNPTERQNWLGESLRYACGIRSLRNLTHPFLDYSLKDPEFWLLTSSERCLAIISNLTIPKVSIKP
jgi:hypothetical protein